MKRSLILVMLGLTVALIVGCSKESSPSVVPQALASELASDSKTLEQQYKAWTKHNNHGFMPLNLANDSHYQFILKRLKASGKDAANSPELFERLSKARIRRQELKKQSVDVTAQGVSTQNLDERGYPWCGHWSTLKDSANGSYINMLTSASVTCYGGAEYMFIDASVYKTNPERTEFALLSSTSNEEYMVHSVDTPILNTNFQPGVGRIAFVDSISISFSGDKDFTGYAPSETEASFSALNANIILEHPTNIVIPNPNDDTIRTCLERGSLSSPDCDYASVNKTGTTISPWRRPFTGVAAIDPGQTSEWVADPDSYFPTPTYNEARLYMAFRGEVTSACANGMQATPSSRVWIKLMEAGGTCQAGRSAGTIVYDNFSLPFVGNPSGTNKAVFDGLLDFGKDCLGNLQNVQVIITASYKCVGETSTKAKTVRLDADWRNSCLAEGTRVTRADGTSIPIERIALGDRLVTGTQGLTLTVTDIDKGIETSPMVLLRDNHGNELLATSTHPLIRGDGTIVPAEALRKGDTVLTQNGPSVIAFFERVKYEGNVYNLALGTQQELVNVAKNERTMIANGFVAGDKYMQFDLERKTRQDAQIVAKLPASWHVDYKNSKTRRLAMR